MKTYNPYMLGFGLLVFAGVLAAANIDGATVSGILLNPVARLAITAVFFLTLAFVATYKALDAMKYMIEKKEGRITEAEEPETEPEEEESSQGWVSKLLQKMQDSKPVEEEKDIVLHHDYDGIRELDNNLPPWWLYGFYASIVFSVIYLLRFHVFETAPLQLEEYRMEMQAAAEAKEEYLKTAANLVDETNVTLLREGPALQAGASLYKANCAVCHAPDGGGGVGPNLTDPYWMHGGSINDVFSTIKYGVPSKGMIAWKDQLSPKQLQELASYILSLQGSSPGNPKEPQGEIYTSEDANAEGEEAAEPTASL